MKNLKQFLFPDSLKEAIKALKDHKTSVIVAGNTSLIFRKSDEITTLIDITRTGLDYIEVKGEGVYIGATNTIQTLLQAPVLQEMNSGLIPAACRKIASRPLRNAITVGGNCMQVYHWNDLPAVLLATDSLLFLNEEETGIPAGQFFETQPKSRLPRETILREIFVPKMSPQWGLSYLKFTKTEVDYAIASIAVGVKIEDGICLQARVVVAGVIPIPRRIKAIEDFLAHKSLDPEIETQAGEMVKALISPRNDIRVSKDYQLQLTAVLVRRGIEMARNRAV